MTHHVRSEMMFYDVLMEKRAKKARDTKTRGSSMAQRRHAPGGRTSSLGVTPYLGDRTSTFHRALAEKKAGKKDDKDDESHPVGLGLRAGAGIVGGGAALHASRPRITGRTKVYRGGSRAGAKRMLEEGIKSRVNAPAGATGATSRAVANLIEGGIMDDPQSPFYGNLDTHDEHNDMVRRIEKMRALPSSEMKPGGALDTLKSEIPSDRAGDYHTYMTESKLKQNLYAAQHPTDAGGKLTIDLPWRLKQTAVLNPELVWQHKMLDQGAGAYAGMSPEQIENYKRAQTFLFKNDVVIPGDIESKHIVGGKGYRRFDIDEIKDYARHNKGRFATGVGLGALGIAGIGYGGKKLYDRYKQRKQGN